MTTQKRRPPLIHVCLLHRQCWVYWWRYGMPLRVHVAGRFVTVVSGEWRSRRVWSQDPADIITMPKRGPR